MERHQLNEMQRKWFDVVTESLASENQLRLIVNGTVGTGKSHTIAAISHALPKEDAVRCAFTAKALFLIQGDTLHKTFNILVESGSKRFAPLNSAALARLQAKISSVRHY